MAIRTCVVFVIYKCCRYIMVFFYFFYSLFFIFCSFYTNHKGTEWSFKLKHHLTSYSLNSCHTSFFFTICSAMLMMFDFGGSRSLSQMSFFKMKTKGCFVLNLVSNMAERFVSSGQQLYCEWLLILYCPENHPSTRFLIQAIYPYFNSTSHLIQ